MELITCIKERFLVAIAPTPSSRRRSGGAFALNLVETSSMNLNSGSVGGGASSSELSQSDKTVLEAELGVWITSIIT